MQLSWSVLAVLAVTASSGWAAPNSAASRLPVVTSCGQGQTAVFLLQHNATSGPALRQLATANFADCSEHCAQAADCAGVEFANNQCTVFADTQPGVPAQQHSIIVKSCVKSDRVCSSPFQFDVFPQKILVGFAREVVPAESLQVCLSACLNSFDTFGFECESVMYYPADAECILNTEDRLDRPDLFVDEIDDTVIYLDNNCAGSQCYAPYITQYIAVEGKQLANELDRIINVDFESCQSLCTQRLSLTTNDFNCKSFMYNKATRTCVLSDERSRPLGRAELVSAEGFIYYEKKCFASPNTCRNSPSFTRVPQKILVGFAAFVMENVPSVTMCLDQCTNPPPETGHDFVCKSVMYYYNEQECILNAETRHSKPELFIPEGDEFQVDYFDISCSLTREPCPSGSRLRLVRTLNAALPEGDGQLHVLATEPTATVAQCMTKCWEMAPAKCRSFNFNKAAKSCDLMYLDGKSTLRPVVRHGTDLYDAHCLAVDEDCSLTGDGALFSRYLHTRQRGVAAKTYKVVSLNSCLEVCASNPACQGVNYNRRVGECDVFDSIDSDEAGTPHEQSDFYKNLCRVKEIDSGASAAANVPVETHRFSGTVTNKGGEGRHAAELAKTKNKPQIRIEEDHMRRAPQNPDAAKKSRVAVQGLPLHVASSQGSFNSPVAIPADNIHTICNYEGIKVQVKHDETFSGVVFVKNRYDTCRVEVRNSESATLVLGLPKDFGMRPISLEELAEQKRKEAAQGGDKTKTAQATATISRPRRQAPDVRDCGIIDLLNGTYKATVVVQTNNLGIPGLVTSMDQLYEVACDYSMMLGGTVQTNYNMTINGPAPNLIQPRGKIELGNPVLMQLRGGDRGEGLVQAKLGDVLELRWELMAMDTELDFFVRSCTAEPGRQAGAPAQSGDEKLQLIENGCPTPAVAQKLITDPVETQGTAVKVTRLQAFRFDNSASVRVTCQLEICRGDCQSVSCDLKGAKRTSWGRKKRQAIDNQITEFETARYKIPRFAQATTSIVIVDPLQQVGESAALARHAAPREQLSFEQILPEGRNDEHVSTQPTDATGQLCMPKVTVLSVFSLLFLLTAVQTAVVAHYIVRRFLHSRSTSITSTATSNKA